MTKPKEPWQKRGAASKLDEAAVLRLRSLAAAGRLDTREAARIHGVATETIRRAVRGDTFTNLQATPPKDEAQLNADTKASLARFTAMLAAEKDKTQAGTKLLDELDEQTGGKHDAGYD